MKKYLVLLAVLVMSGCSTIPEKSQYGIENDAYVLKETLESTKGEKINITYRCSKETGSLGVIFTDMSEEFSANRPKMVDEISIQTGYTILEIPLIVAKDAQFMFSIGYMINQPYNKSYYDLASLFTYKDYSLKFEDNNEVFSPIKRDKVIVKEFVQSCFIENQKNLKENKEVKVDSFSLI
jgi:hypothetical protein